VANIETLSTAESAELIGAPSERWLIERLRSGAFRGRKIGRHWRMTEQDIADALDFCANDSRTTSTVSSGLTSRSRTRIDQISGQPQPHQPTKEQNG
jgi:hypothetical protein